MSASALIRNQRERADLAEYRLRCVEALLVAAEDAPPEYRSSISTAALRAAVDGTPE